VANIIIGTNGSHCWPWRNCERYTISFDAKPKHFCFLHSTATYILHSTSTFKTSTCNKLLLILPGGPSHCCWAWRNYEMYTISFAACGTITMHHHSPITVYSILYWVHHSPITHHSIQYSLLSCPWICISISMQIITKHFFSP
jgi:hypothetical protein